MKITIVAGARPNFIKIAPIILSIEEEIKTGKDIKYRLVHTGQHYDKNMSDNFFSQLNIPSPDVNLKCGGGTHSEQTGSIMVKFEKELTENRPDIVLVVGDVNSTMACTIVAKKMNIKVAHVEAGIRSGDMTMPEEINRIVTDSICDYFFTTTKIANKNLLEHNISNDRIYFVGNTMIDSLLINIDRVKKPQFFTDNFIKDGNYFLLTIHRPSNVDEPEKLKTILKTISESVGDSMVIFPIHPRTKNILDKFNISFDNIISTSPQGYLEFIYMIKNSKGVITDSGGVTEETTVLNIPCITMRNSTERPETVEIGTNELIGDDMDKLKTLINKINSKDWKVGNIPDLWDGKTSKRIIKHLLNMFT